MLKMVKKAVKEQHINSDGDEKNGKRLKGENELGDRCYLCNKDWAYRVRWSYPVGTSVPGLHLPSFHHTFARMAPLTAPYSFGAADSTVRLRASLA